MVIIAGEIESYFRSDLSGNCPNILFFEGRIVDGELMGEAIGSAGMHKVSRLSRLLTIHLSFCAVTL